ncbi:hypothetical protein FXO38_23115 [Capsicum annuum]|nr:hypothetical protein FXO38_23115 [Capsicum annuum]
MLKLWLYLVFILIWSIVEDIRIFHVGSLSFEDLARSLNNRLKVSGQFYLIQGMPLAIQVWLYEYCSNVPPKIASKVVFKKIQPMKKKLAKLQIPKKDAIQHERSVDFDDDFQDPPPRKINEHSKKKQKVDSSTPVAKKPLMKKKVNEHTQTRTPVPRAAKGDGMKTPVFKPIPTRQASSSKMKKEKQTAWVIFPQVQSKLDIHVEKVAVSKPESHVEKEAFISKKDFDAFRDEGCTDLHSEKMNVEIDSQQLIPDELLQSINLDYLHSEKTSDEKIDETILYDSQFTIPDEMLLSLNAYQIQSIIIHPSANRQEEHEILDARTSENVTEDHAQMNKGITDLSSNSLVNSEVELAIEEQVRTPPNTQEVTNDEQRDEQLWPDSQNTIPDEFLPSLNVYDKKNIIIHPSANREVNTPRPKLRIRRPSKFKESPYNKKFGLAAGSSAGLIRIFPQKHSFLYHPIDGIIDTKIVKNFNDWISADLFKASAKRKGKVDHYKRGKLEIPKMHFDVKTVEDKNWFYMMGFADQTWTDSHIDVCLYYLRKKSKFLNDVYSMDHQNLNAGGQKHHLIEYINGFRMHAAVPWHTVEDIFIPVNINKKYHWVLAVLSFSERCIFLYDSYESSDHYAAVLAEIEKIATIIPLCLQACDFYVKKGIDLQNHPRYKDKESSDMFDVLFEDDLPQQSSESLDCGVFMIMYAECLSYGHKVIATEFNPNALCTRYATLLWDYGIRKQEANAISDVEAPLRPTRQSRITSVTEVVDA